MNRKGRSRRRGAFLRVWSRLSKKETSPSGFSEKEIVILILTKAKKKYHWYLQAELELRYKISCLQGIVNSLQTLRNKAGDVLKNHQELGKDCTAVCGDITKAIADLRKQSLAA